MKTKKIHLRSSSRAVALEPRLLFDGAGAVAAVDAIADFDYSQQQEGQVQDVHTSNVTEHSNADADTLEIIEGDEGLHIPANLGSRLGLDADSENILAGTEEKTLLVIDSRVDNYELLLEGLHGNVDVIIVDADQSGLDAISQQLAGKGGYDAIHIISHGTPGSFTLGSDLVDSDKLQENSQQLQSWADALNQGADILLYGCDVAQGEAGQSFIEQMAAITGADIAASTNATGNAEQGGDWVLESATGSIESDVIEFSALQGVLDGGESTPANIKVTDKNGSKGVSIDEHEAKQEDGQKIGEGFVITGSDDDYTVEFSVSGDGILSVDSASGSAANIQAALDALTYTYTGSSEVGYEDVLTITVTDSKGGSTTFTRKINITPVNDAPTTEPNEIPDTFSQENLQVDEKGEAFFKDGLEILKNGKEGADLGVWQKHLGLYDPDTKAEQIIIKLTAKPGEGTLMLGEVVLTEGAIFSLDQIDQLKYKHDGTQVKEARADTFTLTIDDGAGGTIETEVKVDLVPVNDKPIIEGAITIIQGEGKVNLADGGPLPVIGGERGSLKVTDADDSDLTYEILGLPMNDGKVIGELYYGETLLTSSNLATIEITDLSKLSYKYPANLEPKELVDNPTVSFQLQVKDSGGGEGAGKEHTVTHDIVITVLDNNNDPYFYGEGDDKPALALPEADDDGVITVKELDYQDAKEADGSYIKITEDMLPVFDSDSFDGNVVFTIKGDTAATSGYFALVDADGNNPKLLAQGKDDKAGKEATFTLDDVKEGKVRYYLFGQDSSERTDHIDFVVKDGAKTIIFPDDGSVAFDRDGGIYQADKAQNPNVTDADLQVFRLSVKVPAGTKGGEGGQLPDLPPIADAITVGGDKELSLLEGQGKLGDSKGYKFTNADLDADDGVSQPKDMIYRLETYPTTGELWLGDKLLRQFDSFTQADIDNGDLVFKHEGGEQFTDSFNFSVSNGSITTDSISTFNITVTPQNDSPTADDVSVNLNEGGAIEIPIKLDDSDNHTEDKNSDNYDSEGYNQFNNVGYRVESVPEHGDLYLVDVNTDLDGVNYANIPEGWEDFKVTKDDIYTSGALGGKKLVYVHDGTENYSAEFKIRPLDNAGVGFDENGNELTGEADKTTDTNQSSLGAKATISITINPRNDAPQFVAKSEPGVEGGGPIIYEGEQITIWGAKEGSYSGEKGQGTAQANTDKDYYLLYQDSDSTNVQRQYRVTEAPKYGTLTLDGKVLAVGSVFTQADLDRGAIEYKHDGSEHHEDGFNYAVSDGDWTSTDASKDRNNTKTEGEGIIKQGSYNNEFSRYTILVAPTNDAPEINRTPAADADGKQHIVVDSVDPQKATSLGKFEITDPDLDDEGVDKSNIENENFRVTVETPDDLTLVYSSTGSLVVIESTNNQLVLEGNREELEDFLENLKVRIADDKDGKARDPNTELTIKVTVDDRIYNDYGDVDGANGGDQNDIDGVPTDIPGKNEKDPKSNTSTIEIKVWASAVNNTPELDGLPENITVNEDGWNSATKDYNEDGRTLLNFNDVKIIDADAFDTDDNTLTLTVTEGELYFSQSGTDLPEGTTLVASEGSGVGEKKVTLSGTRAALEAALKSVYYKAPQDFNGNDKLTVKFDDNDNIGQDQDGGEKPSSFVETSLDIYILPVNDKPVLGGLKQEGGTGTITPIPSDPEKPISADSYVTLTDSYEFSDDNNNAISFTDPDRKPAEEEKQWDANTGHQYAAEDGEYTVTLEATLNDVAHGKISLKPDYSGDLDATKIEQMLDIEDGKLTITGTYDDIHELLRHGIIYQPGEGEGAENENIKFSVTVGDGSDGGTEIEDSDTNGAGLGDAKEDSFSFFFQRTDANDPPEFTLEPKGPTFAAHGEVTERVPVILDPNAQVEDPELDLFSQNGGSWAGAVLELGRGNTTEGDNTITANSGDVFGFGNSVSVSEDGKISINGKHVANFVDDNEGIGTLEIEFTENAKSTDVNDLLKSITYTNKQDTEALNAYGESAAVTIVYSMRDGNNNNSPTDGVNPEDQTGGGQDQGTGGQLTGYGKITVDINRQVVAKPDVAEVTEPGGLEDTAIVKGDLTPGKNIDDATGNDSTNKAQDHDPDAGDTIKVIEVTQGDTTGTVDNDGKITIQGKYGELVVQPDGSYSYTVDPENLTVQGLLPGETLEDEVFTYKVNDDQGEESTTASSTLTITINGSNDPVTVKVEQPPAGDDKIDPADPARPSDDRTTADHIVFESGLNNDNHKGTSPNPDAIKVENSFTIDALDGLDADQALLLTVGGTTTSLTKEQLEKLGDEPKKIDTEYGELVLDGYAEDPGTGQITIDYTYTLTSKSSDTDGSGVVDTVTIKAQDRGGKEGGGKDSDEQKLQFKIVDDAPQAEDDSGTVRSGETLTSDENTNVLKNDNPGADGWNTSGAVVGVIKGADGGETTSGANTAIQGDHGTLTLNSDGSYSYQAKPNTPDGSTDTFIYTVEDADGNRTTAKLVITVSGSDLAPLEPVEAEVMEAHLSGGSDPQDGGAVITADLPLKSGGVDLKNPVVVDGSGPQHGTVQFNDDGTYSYTLNKAVVHTNGDVSDSFTYQAQDEFGNTVTNTVTVKIIDDKPEAKDDTIALGNKDSARGSVITGKDNNSGTTGDPDVVGADGVTVTGLKKGSDTSSAATGNIAGSGVEGEFGTLVLKADGGYVYTRNATPVETGTDIFTYTITDADGDTSTATITINIGNQLPKDVVVIDGDNKTVTEAGLSGGSDQGNGHKVTGTITFTPGDGEHSVEVTTPGENGTAKITNVSEPDASGKITITYEYELTKPTSGDNQTEKFTVTITDEDGDNASAEVTIKIQDDGPTAKPDTNTVVQNGTVTGSVTANDSPGGDGWKADGSKVTGIQKGSGGADTEVAGATVVSGEHGTLTIHPDGSYSYTARPIDDGIAKEDVFSYTIVDADGTEANATLTITVSPNSPPVANDDHRTTNEDLPIKGNVIGGGGSGDVADSDPDGDPLTVTEIKVSGKVVKVPENGSSVTVDIPGKGTLVIDKTGGYTFTPVSGGVGKVPPIEYSISDGKGGEASAKLNITITPGNPPPAPPAPTPMEPEGSSPLYDPTGGSDKSPLTGSAVITDPSVFHEGERWDDVRRLPIPLHPVLYVNNEVSNSQGLREQADHRAEGQVDLATVYEPDSSSLARGLGQDHNLFVSHAIRSSQGYSSILEDRVNSRLGRTNLSGDDLLASPELRQADPEQMVTAELFEQQQPTWISQPQLAEEDSEDTTQELDEHLLAEAQVAGAAPSFTEQLRGGGKRLPMAARDKTFLTN